ncbi:hypothetical protein [Planomicrobium okeanokoites]|uniref:hypothetical protein n=1 Tax=Planomicrobium okeanokoites TaxID=244 RepID=UPI0024903087|nr:hypothetical protein [Planomicrobium okeanokoites]
MELNVPKKLESIYDVDTWIDRCADINTTNLLPKEKILINMSKLRWVSPVGIGALAATLQTLCTQYKIEVLIPDHKSADKVIGYMERMDFFKICPQEVKRAFDRSCDMSIYYDRKRTNQQYTLFELRKVSSYSDVGPLQNSVRDIMRGKIPRNRVSDIASIVGELANNSIEHGGTPCFPCIQYYPSQKKLEIAICDYGIGIVNSLKDVVKSKSSHDLVEKAIFTNASGVVNEDRGRGLIEVQERTFGWSSISEFYVRTHDTAYQVSPKKIKELVTNKYYMGTYYYIVINMSE